MLEFKDLFPRNVLEIGEWQERADNLKDTVKNEIKKIYEAVEPADAEKEIPTEHAKHFLSFYQKIGRRGLLKLLWQINQQEKPSPDDARVKELLEDWKEKDYRLRLSIHQTYKYLTNKRKKLYENLSLWLRKNYSHLVWESDLSLKQMAEQAPKISMNSKDVAIKRGNKFRQYAGLSILRGKIKEHNNGNGWLISAKSANTTRVCRVCDSMCEMTAELMLQCPNGHTIDQDANSCDNLLKTIPEDLIFKTARETIFVPAHLEKYIVPVVVEV